MHCRIVHKYLHGLILDNGKTSTAGVLSVFFMVALQPALVASLFISAAASFDDVSIPYLREESLYFLNCNVTPVLLSICFGA